MEPKAKLSVTTAKYIERSARGPAKGTKGGLFCSENEAKGFILYLIFFFFDGTLSLFLSSGKCHFVEKDKPLSVSYL